MIELKTFADDRGNLTVVERQIPFEIKRIFYIYGVDNSRRGGHRHHKTIQLAICINGSCKISNDDGISKQEYHLSNPDEGLILNPEDWHEMYDFSEEAILLVLASEYFDPKDYIYEKYH